MNFKRKRIVASPEHQPGYRVAPLGRIAIRQSANRLRQILGIEGEMPIVRIAELVLPTLIHGYEFHVLSKEELRDIEGLTKPPENTICIREDVYEQAIEGLGRPRFTIAHELGHLFLHRDVRYARSELSVAHKPFEDSEWQANCFAGELLMPYEQLKNCKTIEEVERKFSVSREAAMIHSKACKLNLK